MPGPLGIASIFTHVADAKARLIQQFRDESAAPNLNAILEVFINQVQLLENTLLDVGISKLLDYASGAQLDMIGRIVNEKRLGREDGAYLDAIRLRIYINSSSGTPEELINIAGRITESFIIQYIDISPAALRLVITGWTPDSGELLAFMQRITPAGVRIVDITNYYPLVRFKMGDRMKTRLLH